MALIENIPLNSAPRSWIATGPALPQSGTDL